MNEQAIRFRVGVFVLGALILLGVLIVLFAGQPTFLRSQNEYPIVLSDATGIGPGTPVRRAGVRIGEVKRLELDDARDTVRVIIVVDTAHPPLEGDQAVVVRGLLGADAHIDLVPAPGPKKMERLGAAPILLLVSDPPPGPPPPRQPLPPGTEIPAAPGSGPGALAQQASTLIPQTQRALEQMEKTLRDYDRLAGPLNAAIKEYSDLASASRKLLPELQKTNSRFQTMASNWDQLGQRLDRLVSANQQKLTTALDNLNSSLTRINNTFNEENQRNLAATLKNARTSSERFDTITNNTNALLQESRATIGRVNNEITRTDVVLNNLQQATAPLAEHSGAIVQNLDQGSAHFNSAMTSLQALLPPPGRSNGTLGLLLNDPSLYNNLDAAACMLDRILPRVDRMIKDLDVFADKIARHPEIIGLGGVVHPSTGLKQSPFEPTR